MNIHFDTEEDREKANKIAMLAMEAIDKACKEHDCVSSVQMILNVASSFIRFSVETSIHREFWLQMFDKYSAEVRDGISFKKMILEVEDSDERSKVADEAIEKLCKSVT